MTSRERFLAALLGAQPDRVPLWELEFHLYDRYAPLPLVLGRAFAALCGEEQERALWRNAETMAAVVRRLGFDAVTTPGGYWEVAPGVPAYFWLPDDAPWRQLTILRAVVGDELALVKTVGGMICPPSGAGYVEFCYRLFDAPEEIDTQAEQTLISGLAMCQRAREAGADAVCNPCDIADNHGVFFSPEQLERFWLPYLHRWTAGVRELGLAGILHSDGNLTQVLDLLAASGLHGLQAIDPIAGMDILAVKARVGDRLCLCGNIDCGLLQFGPPSAIHAETVRVCTHVKPGGRFILGASNAVFPEVPLAHYEAMLEGWREGRGY